MKYVHLIGVGGVGMRALADLLIGCGYMVSGSDANDSQALRYLSEKGVKIYIGHSASNVTAADMVVRSSAIKDNHVEWQAAIANNKELLHRSDMLRRVMSGKQVIAVTGAHGKTSTTAMIAHVLLELGYNPSFAIGSSWSNYECGASYSNGEWAVIEADESDGSFLRADVNIGIVLNIDLEHMDYYHQKPDNLYAAYSNFMCCCKDLLVYPISDQDCARLIKSENVQKKISFGNSEAADIRIDDLGVKDGVQYFQIISENESFTGSWDIVGQHQLSNIGAAYSACKHVGITMQQFVKAVRTFVLPGRRFEILGLVSGTNDTILIDDYGHHPVEISASIKALVKKYPRRRIVHVFQPHKYSRLRDLFEDFSKSLLVADVVIVLEVYSAGELPISGYSGRDLFLTLGTKSDVYYAETLESAKKLVYSLLEDGDVVFCQGAGDVTKLAHDLMEVCNV